MKKSILPRLSLILLSGLPFQGFTQWYVDHSSNLPDDGAKGPSMDVRAADLDLDGDLDLVLANEFKPNTILWNNGHGVFVKMDPDQLPQPIHDSEDVAIADFNLDGHPDLLFCSEDDIHMGIQEVHEYYLGDGTGTFTRAPFVFPDSEANAVITMDVDQDGRPDVIFGNKGQNQIFINKGDGSFIHDPDRLPLISRTTQDLAFADVDGDTDVDLFEANENGNVLYLNDGEGVFADVSTTHLPQGINMETRKATFGDVDGDGDPDLFLSNVMFIQGKNIQNRLYINDGTGRFSDETGARLPGDGDHTIDAIMMDVDLDTDPDLILANVFGARIKVYLNDGMGIFTDGTDAALGQSFFRDALGVIAADLSGDGLKDIYICDRFMPQSNRKDLLLVRTPISTVESSSMESTAFHIYPNPINTTFFVNTSGVSVETVMIENLQGQILDSLELEWQDEGLYRGDVGPLKLTPGMYVLRFPESGKKVMVMVRS